MTGKNALTPKAKQKVAGMHVKGHCTVMKVVISGKIFKSKMAYWLMVLECQGYVKCSVSWQNQKNTSALNF